MFRSYAGVKLRGSRIEFLDGRISKFYLRLNDCGRRVFVGSNEVDNRSCVQRLIETVEKKLGQPVVTKVGEAKVYKWDRDTVEITVEPNKVIGKTAAYYKNHQMAGMGGDVRSSVVEIRHVSRAGEIDARIAAEQRRIEDEKQDKAAMAEAKRLDKEAAARNDL